jgi:2-aminoethylphosphonate-pyruvate transaminase
MITDQAQSAPDKAPVLLTPGPLTTRESVRHAMLRDWGSRNADFIALMARLRQRLAGLVHAEGSHVCVPVQGSGTFALEAALGTLLERTSKLLILINGAYGRRMAQICERIGQRYAALEGPEDEPVNLREVVQALDADSSIRHLALVHCETTSGILNPLSQVAELAAERGCGLIVDGMSSFGGLPIDGRAQRFDALIASANKCLEGAPGLSFVIVRRSLIEACAGNAHSLSLDLYEQWRGFEANGQWRFTPPTQVAAALEAALDALAAEGGVAARSARYRENCRTLIAGMRSLGFVPLLREDVQAPIIVTFREPADPRFDFVRFYKALERRGYVIYPGKLASAPSFRIGCIGAVGVREMEGAVEAVQGAVKELGLTQIGPQA